MTGKKSRKELIESSESEEDDDSYESSTRSDESVSEPDRVFCKCGEPNTGRMIGCDGLGCLYEWLHYDCAGVDPKDIPKGKWLCRDCQSKQKEEEIPGIPSGQFVWPAANPNKENNSGKEADPIMESSLNQAEAEHASNMKKACDAVIINGRSVNDAAQQFKVGRYALSDYVNDQQKATPEIPTRQFVRPSSNPNKEKNSGMEVDPIMESSLNQAQAEHVSNIRKACDAVIHRGKSVSDAAQQFKVGRYVLSDYVNDQLKRNLSKACESVLEKKYSVQRAAVTFGVIPAILEERVKAVANNLCTPDCREVERSLTSTFFEENLQQACNAVVLEKLTIEAASTTFKVPLEVLKKRLQLVRSDQPAFTTQEENDLVKLCIKLTVLGKPNVKSIVMSTIKQLLDEEESLGIKRLHLFPDNKPNDFWWDAFRKRHPEFETIEGVSSQSSAVESPQSNSVTSNIVENQFLTQPTNLSSGPSNVMQIVPTSQINAAPSRVILKPVPPQSIIIQNSSQNNNQPEIRPTPPTTNQVFYILNTPQATTKQFLLVKQNPHSDEQLSPVTEAGSNEVGIPTPTVFNQPECEADTSQTLEDLQQNSRHDGHRENVLPTSVDSDCHPKNVESGTVEIKDPDTVLITNKVTREDTEVADILNGAQKNPEMFESPSSEIEPPNSVDGMQEVILPSIDVGSNEVVQTDRAFSDETSQPASTIRDHKLPQMRVVANNNESVVVGSDGADHIDQVVANEVVETSLVSPSSVAPSDGDVATSEALQPQLSIANEQSCVAAPQTVQEAGLNEITTALEIAQPSPMAASIAAPRPNLKFSTNQFAPQSNLCVVTNQVVQAQPSFIVPPSPVIVANQVAQPGQVIQPGQVVQPTPIIVANQVEQPGQLVLNQNVIQPNLVANTNQIPTQNYVIVPSTMIPSKSYQSLPAGTVKPTSVVSMALDSSKVGIPNKELQTYLDVTGGGDEGMPLVMPMSGAPRTEKPLPQPRVKVFVDKPKVDKSLPDALTCLEKTLTEEQRKTFAFRLQIGDDRQDDAVYNAWRALKRLYHHKNIYSMYDKKAPNVDKIPFSYDLPVATKLLKTPLMDPVNYDDRIPKERDKQGWAVARPGIKVLAELRCGRKRRHITAVLARREAERRKKEQDARRFLEPWRYQMTMPGKRKRFIARYAEESFPEEDELEDSFPDEDEDEHEDESEDLSEAGSQNLVMDIDESLDDDDDDTSL